MPTCYRVRKPIKVGPEKRAIGDLVPETRAWKPWAVDHLERQLFIEPTECDEAELLAALTYCPEVAPLWGYKDQFEEVEAPEPAARLSYVVCGSCDATVVDTPEEIQAHWLDKHGVPDLEEEEPGEPASVSAEDMAVQLEVTEEDLLPEEESILSAAPAPVDYDAMPWPELKALGMQAGLGPAAKKADIIAHLKG